MLPKYNNSRPASVFASYDKKNPQRLRSLAVCLALVVVGLFSLPLLWRMVGSESGNLVHLNAELAKVSDFRIILIADLDKQSKRSEKVWEAPMKEGRLKRSAEGSKYEVEWTNDRILKSGLNEAGRGMELSELVNFNGHVMTMDDRTGIVFEVVMGPDKDDKDSTWVAAPRHVFGEGNGAVAKGMKFEWATVKDGELILGSFGKEYTNSEGTVVNTNNMWIDIMDKEGRASREDWTERYVQLRNAAGAKFPGYMIHEAGLWSALQRQWVFLPRRLSQDPYDDGKDERMGTNKILIVDEAFEHIEVREVGTITPERGFSSCKFVPGTNDQVVVALKSAEFAADDSQTSFITVFTLDGVVLLEETEITDGFKYEGIEVFLD